MKKGIDKIKKLMYYISMITQENYLNIWEEDGITIIVIEKWTIDATKYKKPLRQWYFKKENTYVKTKEDGRQTAIVDTLELKEYKSKQAVINRFKKEKDMMQRNASRVTK